MRQFEGVQRHRSTGRGGACPAAASPLRSELCADLVQDSQALRLPTISSRGEGLEGTATRRPEHRIPTPAWPLANRGSVGKCPRVSKEGQKIWLSGWL